jgi:leucyl-tRNA synthetase
MTKNQPHGENLERARLMRKTQTVAEGLLWSVLRARQLCGLKFRRQHPIPPWIVDFACPQQMLIVELDGAYHDYIVEKDLRRQENLVAMGWRVMRFRNDDVEDDVEAIAHAIAKELNLDFQFSRRKATGSGMRNLNAKKKE